MSSAIRVHENRKEIDGTLWIDTSTLLPVRWEVFEDSTLTNHLESNFEALIFGRPLILCRRNALQLLLRRRRSDAHRACALRVVHIVRHDVPQAAWKAHYLEMRF